MRLAVGARTDVGLVRQGNEDSYLVDSPLFAIADGMGGHAAGDVASATAVEIIKDHRSEIRADDPSTLVETVRDANRAIWDKSENDPTVRGMGTTCTIILVDGSTAQVAHVGDSRAYLLHAGELKQITDDHTLVGRMVREGKLKPEEAERHPQRSMITRALGVDEDVEVDQFSLPLAEGDRFIICSDGLSGMLSETQIAEVLGNEPDPQAAADKLVERANEAGGEDNITVIVVDVGVDEASAPDVAEHRSDLGERAHTDPSADTGYHRAVEITPKRSSWRKRLVVSLLVLCLIAGGGFFAARYALNNSWFIGVDDQDVVTIYRGIPDEVAGLSLKEVHERSTIDLEALPTFKRDEVEAGIKVDSLEEAEATLSDLERLAKDEDFQNSAASGGRSK
ncbi:MAG: family protein phosphatase [Actinomycetota bacterium]|nr:family protein phosphatase [Actinomycetota bacterium]